MRFLRRLFTGLFMLLSSLVLATHNMGGYITFDHITGHSYEITVVTTTEINANNADRDTLIVGVAGGMIKVKRTLRSPGYYNTNYQRNEYKFQHTFPGPGVFDVSVLDDNRNGGIVNIPNSIERALRLDARINVGLEKNNAPRPYGSNVVEIETGKESKISLACLDDEGDYLSYKLVLPRDSLGPIKDANIPAGATINPLNGELSWTPNVSGGFAICVEVKECRKGHAASTSVIDYFISVVNKVGGSFSDISVTPNDSNSVVFLSPNDSLNIYMKYNSSNALNTEVYSDIPNFSNFLTEEKSPGSNAISFKFLANPSLKRCTPYYFIVRGFDNLGESMKDQFYLINIDDGSLNCDFVCDRIFTSEENLKLEEYEQIKIYPNPANSKISVNIPFQEANISVYDTGGRKIFESQALKGQEIDVKEWPNGLYIIKIRQEKQVFLERLIIQK